MQKRKENNVKEKGTWRWLVLACHVRANLLTLSGKLTHVRREEEGWAPQNGKGCAKALFFSIHLFFILCFYPLSFSSCIPVFFLVWLFPYSIFILYRHPFQKDSNLVLRSIFLYSITLSCDAFTETQNPKSKRIEDRSAKQKARLQHIKQSGRT